MKTWLLKVCRLKTDSVTTGFIADLHLSPGRPDILAAFDNFCQQHTNLDALYILGDLFDAWLGDDDTSEFAAQVKNQLKYMTDSGVRLYFMAGNRDFMVGERFASDVGLTLLPDETVIDLYGERVLLMHGDTLCTLDKGYLRYRAIIQNALVKGIMRSLPLSWRMRIANRLREKSSSQRPELTPEQLYKMDAQHSEVLHVMEKHSVRQLIHGHTHRPAVHCFTLGDGKPAKRIVLGDWYQQASAYLVSK
ncbi:UDP-2,3-diacylglucosamine diphosphatase [Idiomarina sp. PL1-037]|uniref:UDP-2,3-diacylglucosamine diphosphatase n=1 Tax=Idiomarina sp. PL1-037 TaxID=3095365 RepID=UPI002ACBDAD2|nr:UDP-2,3-diacylglucosamine diphosphatase [Idiomarina sp. PL1-037]WQC53861.1 UDP-2,3-diacylglucosamine diphosphatase [Idiomarina sp. PL1-037]